MSLLSQRTKSNRLLLIAGMFVEVLNELLIVSPIREADLSRKFVSSERLLIGTSGFLKGRHTQSDISSTGQLIS